MSGFRGMGYNPSFARNRGTKGSALSLQSLTDIFLEKLKSKSDDLIVVVQRHWGAVVGERFAGKCAAMNVRLGVLYVSTCNMAIKQELLFMQHTMLAELHKLDGGNKITKIRFL